MWRKLRQLAPSERRLLQRAMIHIVAIRLALWLLPWSATRRWAHRLAAPPRHLQAPVASDRIAWAVHAVSRRIPGGRNCLVRALAAHTLLARYGHASTIHLGVRRGSEARFDAHAWVTCAGRTLIGGTGEGFTVFEPLELVQR